MPIFKGDFSMFVLFTGFIYMHPRREFSHFKLEEHYLLEKKIMSFPVYIKHNIFVCYPGLKINCNWSYGTGKEAGPWLFE